MDTLRGGVNAQEAAYTTPEARELPSDEPPRLAQLWLALEALSLRAITLSRMNVHSVSSGELHKQLTPDVNNPLFYTIGACAAGSVQRFIERTQLIRQLSSPHLGNPSGLFERLFDRQTTGQVAIERLVGGFVCRCSGDDYRWMFSKDGILTGSSRSRADASIGVAGLEATGLDGCQVPVACAVNVDKCNLRAQNAGYDHDSDRLVGRHELMHLLIYATEPAQLAGNNRLRQQATAAAEAYFDGNGLPNYKNRTAAVDLSTRYILEVLIERSTHNEVLAQLTSMRTPRYICERLAAEVAAHGKLYDYITQESAKFVHGMRMANLGAEASVDNFAKLVLLNARCEYKSHLMRSLQVVDAFMELHTEYQGPQNRDRLVALLLPHAFHTWPTVLRAVSRELGVRMPHHKPSTTVDTVS